MKLNLRETKMRGVFLLQFSLVKEYMICHAFFLLQIVKLAQTPALFFIFIFFFS
jgi:hypothetical protein